MDLLYGDLDVPGSQQEEEEPSAAVQARAEFDPLQGESFSLASMISRRGGAEGLPTKKIAVSEFSVSGGLSENYVQRQSPVFFGPPPPHSTAPHDPDAIVVISRLTRSINDAEIRKTASEIFGPVRCVRVLVEDVSTGISSGVALVEFVDPSSASKAVSTGFLLTGLVRKISKAEFDKIATGNFPILDYGPISPGEVAVFNSSRK